MTIDDMKKLLNPLKHRIMLMIARAAINSMNDVDGGYQAGQVSILDGEVRDNTVRLQDYGFTSVPLQGADAVVVFIGGNRDHGLIIATDDSRYRLQGMKNGEVALYTDEGDHIYFKRGKIIEIKCGSEIDINCATVKFSGDIQVSGKITAGGEITGGNSEAPVNLTTHEHPTAVPGSPSPPTPGT